MVPLPSSLASFFTTSDAVEDTSGERRKFSPSSESF
jgi:hypothetical protein